MSPQDPILRARRWQSFYEEAGGLKDILSDIGTSYIQRMSAIAPWEPEAERKLLRLSMANRIVGQIDNLVQVIIGDGQLADQAQEHARKIENLPERKRRWL
ncbi:MAG: hypothetical protein ABF461_04340 [Zymomonas mobilis subsp. pomaceae]|uniref:Uncharacterized protein n=1 Tax=Zymomonas mobilis subsp. pomaceae (strain ATCC 29192 / DSM 22645 / JCM 10191 / CCUG 17912 / NBRC 13757 / NCIMB 11200 / NRRL B-4491 / Barker I) TaxID=579138 RepID=F8ESE7_ZYMMT|nr:hypothetical protein [Zymomonas mobilis]AEI37722.1 hypothetical protein Zymop_0821 [Zymomonas mobilis subsp. pomaceae ATCC 29192]MDX5949089.1 hypothetical protein [Zymomonas mobilis subsp. pomaceae]GEB88894.1 hypothetical protein ZMO02_05310 [Zymomonas mobilis subsp. pomaceae]